MATRKLVRSTECRHPMNWEALARGYVVMCFLQVMYTRSNCMTMDKQDCQALLSWPPYQAKLVAGNLTSCEARPCQDFAGAICDARGRLRELNLPSKSLVGTLPAQYSALRTLYKLDLSKNNLGGTLPANWSALNNLSILYLGNNMITGTLPIEWASCTNLTNLYIDNNKLAGTLPVAWDSLSKMQYLGLFGNLLRGPVPRWSSWKNSTDLSLYSNSLTGTLPATWGDFRELRVLNLHNTQLSGTVPATWRTLSKLLYVDLRNTKLTGALPWPEKAVHLLRIEGSDLCVPKAAGRGCTAATQAASLKKKKRHNILAIATGLTAGILAAVGMVAAAICVVRRRYGGLGGLLPQASASAASRHKDKKQLLGCTADRGGSSMNKGSAMSDMEAPQHDTILGPKADQPTLLISRADQAQQAVYPSTLLKESTTAPRSLELATPPMTIATSAARTGRFTLSPPVNNQGISAAPAMAGMAVSRHMRGDEGGGAHVILADVGLMLPLCIQLGLKIVEISQRVVANNARCSQLVARITAMQPLLLQLQEQTGARSTEGKGPSGDGGNGRILEPVVRNIHEVFCDVHDCICSWSSHSRLGSIATLVRNMAAASWFQEGFVELNVRLSGAFTDLCTALHIQDRSLRHSSEQSLRRRLEEETGQETAEDLRAMVVELVGGAEEGREAWLELETREREKVAAIFRHQQLDLTSTLREARKAALERTASALLIPPADIIKGRPLGKGGCGEVHAATWKRSSAPVAIKRLDMAGTLTDRDRDDMLREAFIHSRAHNHPNVCQLYGVVLAAEGPECALVMELAASDLAAVIRDRDVVLSVQEKYRLALQVAQGMAHLHARGITHGDLKPSNVLIHDNGRATVSDFGLSSVSCLSLSSSLTAARAADAALPGSSTAVTLAYCPPELLSARTTRRMAAGDVFSFGIMLVQIFSGEAPYGEMPYEAVLRHVLGGGRPAVPAWVPAGCAQLAARCWEDDPAGRPGFEEVAGVLQDLHDAAEEQQ